MRVARTRVVAEALAALDWTAARVVHGEPMQAPPLRAALLTLWALGDGEAAPFDAFWAACGEGAGGRARRAAALAAARTAIARALVEHPAGPLECDASPALAAARARCHRLLNPPAPVRAGRCGWS